MQECTQLGTRLEFSNLFPLAFKFSDQQKDPFTLTQGKSPSSLMINFSSPYLDPTLVGKKKPTEDEVSRMIHCSSKHIPESHISESAAIPFWSIDLH